MIPTMKNRSTRNKTRRSRLATRRARLTSQLTNNRQPGIESLEPILLLSGDPPVRGFQVSSSAVVFEQSASGTITQRLTDTPVVSMDTSRDFSGNDNDYLELAHTAEMEITHGTVMMTFQADNVFGYHTLFSKDAYGQGQGGHLTVIVANGRLKARLQSVSETTYLYSPEGSVENDELHHVTVTFGQDGFWMYLDGRMVDWDQDFQQGLTPNREAMVIGANTWYRTDEHPNKTFDPFDGRISAFAMYDRQLDRHEIATIANYQYQPPQVAGRLVGTDLDEHLSGSDVDGGYGNDVIVGTDGNDRLDGGHGEDRLEGGAGDDLLVSRSDGREPPIAQNYTAADDPDQAINPSTRTHYPSQPIEGDDVMVGGPGADTFRFEPLINAKEHIILRHVMDNGMVHWHGVAGENDFVHDHWVDRLGHEVIADFNRAEGDKIEIVGHTADAYDLEHIDTDGDGIVDASVIYLQSNQGNSGAHNKDQLGTITVFGDLVLKSDYTVDSAPAYGIVDSVYALDEAIAPRQGTPVSGNSPPDFPVPDDGTLPPGAVFGMLNVVDFTGEWLDHVEVHHREDLALAEGTIALTFTADDVFGSHALFSKDGYGNTAGHLTAFVSEGSVKVRLQDGERDVWLKSMEGTVLPGDQHHLTVTFGSQGFWMYLDGRMVDWRQEEVTGWSGNSADLAIGANIWSRSDSHPTWSGSQFDGQIQDFLIYDSQLDRHQVANLTGYAYVSPPFPGRVYGSDANEVLSGTDVVGGYGDDLLTGTPAADRLDGEHGQDRLEGGDGDDLLISRSDGREPRIAQDYEAADDPDGQVNPATRTIYVDQPIEANDVLVGGNGADTFRFEVLINAKEQIILEHVGDDGKIHWHGVAGENDHVHDHWVDRLGHEIILDFDRSEGDRIEVVGHTVDVYHLEHIDTNSDGVLDASVLYVQSNQGNAGAHNKDQLGTITVFGDLVVHSDYTVDSKPAYGIVQFIDELDEALAPRVGTPVADVDATPDYPDVPPRSLAEDAVFAMLQETELLGPDEEDYLEIPHMPAMEVANGTIEMTFVADNIWGKHALFSKDADGKGQGGHLTVYIENGQIHARLQSDENNVWLSSPEGSVLADVEYHVAVTFGATGFTLYLDGQPVDIEAEFPQGLTMNTEGLALGATTWSRTPDRPYRTWDHFDGSIRAFTMYSRQLSAAEVQNLATE